MRSCNCPCISPHIVTGALTAVVLVYYENISLALSVISLTCFYVIPLNVFILSIIVFSYCLSAI